MEGDIFVRKNLEWLIKRAKTSPYALQAATKVKQPTIHRILTGESDEPRAKTLQPLADYFGVTVADLRGKDLEAEFAAGAAENQQRTHLQNRAVKVNPGEIEIPQYSDVAGGMGGGVTLRDQPGAIHGWRVTPEWISKNIKSHSGAGNLCIVTGFGNSMQPLYNPGDPLIIDRGNKSVDSDATYFFRVGDEGFIKILQRIPGEGIRVISKNKDYETWTIKPDMDFEVFGQVLKAWCGTDV